MSEAWHAAVAAARRAGKPIYFVNHIAGGTVEATTIRKVALDFKAEQWNPFLYRVFEQTPIGHLEEIG
jgi:hypothetical protein